MRIIKFAVKVNRVGVRIPEYVRRIDRTPIEMTTNRKQALLMGRFTAERCRQIHSNFPAQPGVSFRQVHAG